MSPMYAYGEASPHTYPPYYWAPPNVRGPQPLSAPWPEPYYSYRESPGNYYWPPHDCGFKYGGSPYWHCSPEHQFYRPKFRNSEGDGRDFRPYTYAPPPSSFVYSRPFSPNEQFRQPDDYPMRFAPATGYDRFGHYPFERHCCGCPNHVAYPKPVERIIDDAVDEKRIKDFKDSDGKWMTDDPEKKGSENLQKFTEPIVWIPGSLSDRNEGRHPVYRVPWNREGDPERPFPGYWIPLDSNTASRDPKTEDENAEERHPVYWVPWNRKSTEGDQERRFPGYWIPLDSNTGSRDRKTEDENAKLPSFPIFWIPRKFEGEGDAKVQNPPQETKKTEGPDASNVEHIQQKSIKTNGGEADMLNEGINGRPAQQKKEEAAAREVPVKQLEEKEQDASKVAKLEQKSMKINGGEAEKINEGVNGRSSVQKKEAAVAREIPVKQLGEEGKPSQTPKEERVSKVSDDNHHVKKASSPRATKFPPACLRVDPLPRKKTNGTSSCRSPSPPHVEEESKDKVAVMPEGNANVSRTSSSRSPSPPRKVEESKDKVAVKAEGNANASASKVDRETTKDEQQSNASASNVGIETKKDEQQTNLQEGKKQVPKKIEIGQDQAALKIQALYRGYQVRKFQPLTKLREIMKIKGRVEDLRQQMSSPKFFEEICRDSKARGKFNETSMGLLLQLDTIQGLHPVVRDVRKSVARDLITLQEKVDTLIEQAGANKLQEPIRQTAESDKIAAAEKTEDNITTSEVREVLDDITNGNNQRIDSEKAIDGVNVENKGSVNLGMLEIENKATEDLEDVEEKEAVKQDVLQVQNEAVKEANDIEKAPIEQEGCLYATTKEIKYEEKVETVNQDNNVTGEKDLISVPAEAPSDNATAEERVESGSSNVMLEEKLLDSAMPKEEVANEKLSSAILGQEHGIVDVENENLLDSTMAGEEDAVNEKLPSVALEKEQAIVDVENEKPEDSAVPKEDVVNEKLSSVILGQDHGIVDVENEKMLDSSLPVEEDSVNEKLPSVALENEQAIVDIENENPENSAVPKEDVVNEILSSVTLEQEQVVVDIENEGILDLSLSKEEDVNEKLLSVALEKRQAVGDIENEKLLDLPQPKEEDVFNEKRSSVSLEQKQAFEDVGNVIFFEKTAMVGEDNSNITAAPEVEIDHEKNSEICAAPVSDRNEGEREISHALTDGTEECHDNDKRELTVGVPSLTISHVIKENNLSRLEETLPSNENADGKEPPAAAETQNIGKSVETVNTPEAGLNVQNEEDLIAEEELLLPAFKQPVEGNESTQRCEILQKAESGTAKMEDKPSIDSKYLADNKVEDAHVVNTNESESRSFQCEGKLQEGKDHEKWMEENEKLREMVEKLMSAGKCQMSTILQLNNKIKQLENKLSQGKSKRKVRAGQVKLKNNVTETNRRNSTARGT